MCLKKYIFSELLIIFLQDKLHNKCVPAKEKSPGGRIPFRAAGLYIKLCILAEQAVEGCGGLLVAFLDEMGIAVDGLG